MYEDQQLRDIRTISDLFLIAEGKIVVRSIAEGNTPIFTHLLETLPITERRVLLTGICESEKEYLSTGEIAKVTGLQKRSVSTILRRLERKGQVELLTYDERYPGSPDMNNPKKWGSKRREYKAKVSDPQLKAWWIYQREGSKGLTDYVKEIVLE